MGVDVAIALAVSWKPFVKSNENAAAMTMMRTRLDAVEASVPWRPRGQVNEL